MYRLGHGTDNQDRVVSRICEACLRPYAPVIVMKGFGGGEHADQLGQGTSAMEADGGLLRVRVESEGRSSTAVMRWSNIRSKGFGLVVRRTRHPSLG